MLDNKFRDLEWYFDNEEKLIEKYGRGKILAIYSQRVVVSNNDRDYLISLLKKMRGSSIERLFLIVKNGTYPRPPSFVTI